LIFYLLIINNLYFKNKKSCPFSFWTANIQQKPSHGNNQRKICLWKKSFVMVYKKACLFFVQQLSLIMFYARFYQKEQNALLDLSENT